MKQSYLVNFTKEQKRHDGIDGMCTQVQILTSTLKEAIALCERYYPDGVIRQIVMSTAVPIIVSG